MSERAKLSTPRRKIDVRTSQLLFTFGLVGCNMILGNEAGELRDAQEGTGGTGLGDGDGGDGDGDTDGDGDGDTGGDGDGGDGDGDTGGDGDGDTTGSGGEDNEGTGGDGGVSDSDGDGVDDTFDNCPLVANDEQTDENENGIGDDCEADWDDDGVDTFGDEGEPLDNCPGTPNGDQLDHDLDGTGDACDLDDDNDGTPDEEDCAPLDETASPDFGEICGNAVDEDCSGEADDGENGQGCTDYYFDGDNDTYGAMDIPAECVCVPTAQYSALTADDCDDEDESVNPGATEICNGADDNCDNVADETWASLGDSCDGDDADACEDGAIVCTADGTAVMCNDGAETPNAQEICNGSDDDCDGEADETWPQKGSACDGTDSDQCQDGIWVCNSGGTGVTCNDNASSLLEICDGQDNDCDGSVDEGCDDDGDGYCDINMTLAGNPAVCPNTTSGSVRDCDDANASRNPGTPEVCDGIDNNCGGIDENLSAADEANTNWSLGNRAGGPGLPNNGNGTSGEGSTVSANWTLNATDAGDYFYWDLTYSVWNPGFQPRFMCRVTGIDAKMVQLTVGWFRPGGNFNVSQCSGDNLNCFHSWSICPVLGDSAACASSAITTPSAGGDNYGFGVRVRPAQGWLACRQDYTVTCKLREGTTW